jgi:NADH-quinone oxidoreductase subunit N
MEALICLALVGIILVYSEFTKKLNIQSILALFGFSAVALVGFTQWNNPHSYFNAMASIDNIAISFNTIILASTLLVVLLAMFYYKNGDNHVGEVFGLMAFSIFGAFLITGYTNLIVLYLGIETLSIPLYVLAGSNKSSYKSNEAGFKYFVMGGVASAILLLGIALIYGSFGTFNLTEIASHVTNSTILPGIYYTGFLLILVGFLFKVAAVPFHFWAPDVYEGSPTVVTAFMASVVKIAAFIALYRLMTEVFEPLRSFWEPIIWVVIVLTLVFANVIALNQKNVKRLLAYGSISGTGFLLLAILALTQSNVNVLLYYLVAYVVAVIPAFGVAMAVRKATNGDDSFDAFAGLAKRNPFLAVNFIIALLSLAGIPFTAGFFAKFYLFVIAIKGGFIGITILAVVAAVMGIYYFMRLVTRLFAQSDKTEPIPTNLPLLISLTISSLITLVLGLFPGLII